MRGIVYRAAVFLLVITTISACSARQGVPIGEIPPFQVPPKEQVESTRAVVANALKGEGKNVSVTGADHDRAQRLIDRLSRAAGGGNFHFPVLIADAGKDVNAMVADGKTVVIYKRLMDTVPDDDELATVMAHEIGHVLGKHNEDNGSKSRAEDVSLGSSILGGIANVALSATGYGALGGTVGDLTATTANAVGMGAYVLSYDRDMEYEADEIGMMLMGKAGFNPEAALSFWSKADVIFGDANSLSFFSTHPSNSDRLDRLREYLPLAQKYYIESKSGRASGAASVVPVAKGAGRGGGATTSGKAGAKGGSKVRAAAAKK